MSRKTNVSLHCMPSVFSFLGDSCFHVLFLCPFRFLFRHEILYVSFSSRCWLLEMPYLYIKKASVACTDSLMKRKLFQFFLIGMLSADCANGSNRNRTNKYAIILHNLWSFERAYASYLKFWIGPLLGISFQTSQIDFSSYEWLYGTFNTRTLKDRQLHILIILVINKKKHQIYLRVRKPSFANDFFLG